MDNNKQDFIILKAGWDNAILEILKILNNKYDTYENLEIIKKDIEKLLNFNSSFEQSERRCEILKYYEKSNYGYVILNCIDKIEGYILDLKTNTYMSMSKEDCLFSLNKLEPNVITEYKNEEEARKELENILSKFKKAE